MREILVARMPLDNWYLGFRDASGLWAFPVGNDPHVRDFTPQELPPESLTEHTWGLGRPVRQDARHTAGVDGIGVEAVCWLGVPIHAAGTCFGIIAVQSYDPQVLLDGDEHAILEAVAEAVGPAAVLFLERSSRARVQQAIQEDRDEAVAANNAKSTFLAAMSHELRTPLNAIIGYNELLQEELGELEVEVDGPRHVDRAARLLLALVDDILDLSRLEAGAVQVAPERVDLRDVVQQAIGLIEPLAMDGGNEVECLVPAEPVWVETDARLLLQCLVNLASNAAKFTRNGIVTLRLTAADDAVKLEVADTGMGIAPGAMERLFEPFIQGDGSSTRKHGGAGLGLAITRRFVALLEGELTARSVVGQGSVFAIRLPRGLDPTP